MNDVDLSTVGMERQVTRSGCRIRLGLGLGRIGNHLSAHGIEAVDKYFVKALIADQDEVVSRFESDRMRVRCTLGDRVGTDTGVRDDVGRRTGSTVVENR